MTMSMRIRGSHGPCSRLLAFTLVLPLAITACGDSDDGDGNDPLAPIGNNGGNNTGGNGNNTGDNGGQFTADGSISGRFDARIIDAQDPNAPQGQGQITGSLERRQVQFPATFGILDTDQDLGDVFVLLVAGPGIEGGPQIIGQLIVPLSLYQPNTDIPVTDALFFEGTTTAAGFLFGELTQEQTIDPIGLGVSGSVNFSSAGAGLGDAVEGSLTLDLARVGANANCANGCLQGSPAGCQMCFTDANVCAQTNQCQDQACFDQFCESDFDSCVGDSASADGMCPADFFVCNEGC